MPLYSRYVPRDCDDYERAMVDTVDHIRGHLSSCCDPDDDPENLMNDVTVSYFEDDAGTLITGSLNAEPTAPYLRADFDPNADTDYVFTRYSEDGRE